MPLGAVAGIMVAFQLSLLYLFLPRRSEPARPRLSRAILIAYVLPATALMWAVIPGAVLRPSYGSWWVAIQAMMIPMPAPFFWMMSQLARAEERPINRRGPAWPLLLAGAVVLNETLMGYAFAAIAGASSLQIPATAFALSVNSPWFAASMIATMIGLIVWVPTPSWQRAALAGLAASALAGPLWLLDPVAAAAAMGAIMTVTLLVLVYGLESAAGSPIPSRRFVYGIGAALGAMTVAGIASAALPGLGPDGLPLAVAGLSVMLVETTYLLHEGLVSIPDPTPPFVWTVDVPATA
ncbi:MAG TPA: hypothetical protein VN842_04365 [Thermoplasmata archaeon]|nr:hypothetical protein [Thermoplasmata archaeon]